MNMHNILANVATNIIVATLSYVTISTTIITTTTTTITPVGV